MSVREYIGARYVPLFADPLEWDANSTYEPLTVVLYQGNSYTSRQAVPANIPITNTTYWAQTGNYNAQVEAYRQEVIAETQARTQADAQLQNAIGSEVNTRSEADAQLQTAIGNEINAREQADTQLQKDIDDNKVWTKYHEIPWSAIPDVSEEMINSNRGTAIAFRSSGKYPSRNCALAIRANSDENPAINVGMNRSQASADVVALSTFEGMIPYMYKISAADIVAVSSTSITFASDVQSDVIEGMVLFLTKNLNKSALSTPTLNQKYLDIFENRTYAAMVMSIDSAVITVDGWMEMRSAVNPSAPADIVTPTIDNDMYCFINPQNNVYGEYSYIHASSNAETPKGYKFYGKQIHLQNSADDAMYAHGILLSLDNGSLVDGYNISNIKESGEVTIAYHALGLIKYLIGQTDFSSKHLGSGMTLAGSPVRYNAYVGNSTENQAFKEYGTSNPFGKTLARITGEQVISLDASEIVPNTWYTLVCAGANTGIQINNDRNGIIPTTVKGDNTRHDITVNGNVRIIKPSGHNTHDWIKFMLAIPNKSLNAYGNTEIDLLVETTNDITCTFS